MLARIAAAFLFLCGAAAADDGTLVTATQASADARDITVETEGGTLTVNYADAKGVRQSLKMQELVEIAFPSHKNTLPSKYAPDDVEITLTTGDVVTGKVGAKSGEGVHVQSAVFGNLLVKFEQIRSVVFPANRAFLPRKLPEESEPADIVFQKNGDRGEGTILSISAGGVEYKSKALGETAKPVEQVAGVWVSELEKPPAEPKTLFVCVHAVDGSAMRGSIESLRDKVLSFKNLYGTSFKIAESHVAGITLKNGRVVHVSDLAPVKVEEDASYTRDLEKRPGDLEYPFQRDRSANETPLMIGNVGHRKGLGVRAHCALTYDLNAGGPYARFQSTVGLDAASWGMGAVTAQVFLDGKKLMDVTLKGKDGPRNVDVDVSDGKELRLIVTWADSPVRNFADWGSARLIRR